MLTVHGVKTGEAKKKLTPKQGFSYRIRSEFRWILNRLSPLFRTGTDGLKSIQTN